MVLSKGQAMNFNHPLCQQNKDFFGYTVFTFKFNDIPVRFVTEKDALHVIEQAQQNTKESRPTVPAKRPVQQRKGEICPLNERGIYHICNECPGIKGSEYCIV